MNSVRQYVILKELTVIITGIMIILLGFINPYILFGLLMIPTSVYYTYKDIDITLKKCFLRYFDDILPNRDYKSCGLKVDSVSDDWFPTSLETEETPVPIKSLLILEKFNDESNETVNDYSKGLHRFLRFIDITLINYTVYFGIITLMGGTITSIIVAVTAMIVVTTLFVRLETALLKRIMGNLKQLREQAIDNGWNNPHRVSMGKDVLSKSIKYDVELNKAP